MESQNFFNYVPTEIKSLIFYASVIDCNKKIDDPLYAPTLCLVSAEFRDIIETLVKPRIYRRLSFSYTFRPNILAGKALSFAKTIDIYSCSSVTDKMILSATRLQSLYLSLHPVNITRDCISQLTNLTTLSFDCTHSMVFNGDIFKNLTNLTSLNLMTNASQFCYTSSITHLTKLTSLGFRKDRIQLDELSFYTNITRLETRENTTMTDEILENMPKLKKLKMAKMTQVSPITDNGLSFLTNCTVLQLFYVANTKITDSGISSMTQLKTLAIDKTRFTNDSLKDLVNLTSLIVNRNSNITPKGLKSCPKLKLVSVAREFEEKFSADADRKYRLQIVRF